MPKLAKPWEKHAISKRYLVIRPCRANGGKIIPFFHMKQLSPADFKRLEQKINLLNDKIDQLMAAQGIASVRSENIIPKEEEKKRKDRERKHSNGSKRRRFNSRCYEACKIRRYAWASVRCYNSNLTYCNHRPLIAFANTSGQKTPRPLMG